MIGKDGGGAGGDFPGETPTSWPGCENSISFLIKYKVTIEVADNTIRIYTL